MENRCVCCGVVIPEGKMVCPICEANVYASERKKRRKLKYGDFESSG